MAAKFTCWHRDLLGLEGVLHYTVRDYGITDMDFVGHALYSDLSASAGTGSPGHCAWRSRLDRTSQSRSASAGARLGASTAP